LNFYFSERKDSHDYFFILENVLQIIKNYDFLLALLLDCKHFAILKRTLSRHIGYIIPNLDRQSLKPQFCPGLPIRVILENPVKCSDRIGVIIGSETRKRAHSGIFETGVLSPDHERAYTNTPYAKKMPVKLQ
jgi:hypothetical protein